MDGYRCQAKAKVAELEVHGSKNQLNKGAGCLHGLGDQEPGSGCTRGKQALVRVMCHCGQELNLACSVIVPQDSQTHLGQDEASNVEEVIV